MTRSDSSTEHKDVLSTLLSLFSERTADAGEKFCLCLVQTKRKEKRWLSLFAGEGPNLCCCTRDSYRLLGAPAQSGLGSVCCTILVKLIAGRWKEAAGWTEAPWRQNTSVRGGKKVWKMSYFARHSHPGLPLCYKPFLICEAFGDTSCVSTHIKKKRACLLQSGAIQCRHICPIANVILHMKRRIFPSCHQKKCAEDQSVLSFVC